MCSDEASSESGLASGYINATYSDNSTSSSPVLVPQFWNGYPAAGDIILPYYYTDTTIDYNRSMFYQTINWIDPTRELVSLTLPNVTAGSNSGPGGAAINTRLHLFSVSVLPATGRAIDLEIQYARSTQLWLPETNKTQIVEVIINNVGSDWVLANNSVKVEVSSNGYDTVSPGYITRLQPGDQAKVQVGVMNAAGVASGTFGDAIVKVSGNGVSASVGDWGAFVIRFCASWASRSSISSRKPSGPKNSRALRESGAFGTSTQFLVAGDLKPFKYTTEIIADLFAFDSILSMQLLE